jgi:membrane-associated protein
LPSFLTALHGAPSLVIVCAVLFAEEAGVPLPIAPGEVVLIGAGLLVASGALPVWVVLPAAYVAVLAGCLTGFAWARAIGPDRLRGLASRLRAERGFDRVTLRLRDVGIAGIGVSRVVPCLVIYTSLVAGAVGVSPRRFALGVAPAIAAWAAGYTALGIFFGVPAERLLGRYENLALRAGVVLAVLAITYLFLRRVPPAHAGDPEGEPESRSALRLAGALAIDLGLVAVALAAFGVLTRMQVPDANDISSSVFVVGTISLVYLLVARRSVGHTLGESLLGVRYP